MKGGIQRKGVIAKMQKIKLKKHEVSGKKEVSVCDIGLTDRQTDRQTDGLFSKI